MPTLKSFDAILGNYSLKQLNAVIFFNDNIMTLKNKYNIPIKEKRIQAVNNLNIRTEHMSKEQFTSITNLTKKFSSLFLKPNDRLSFTTCVQAEIRTTSDAPIYTKYYPYPMSLQREVEAQI